MSSPSAQQRFLAHLRTALAASSLVKLTLGKHRGAEASLKNIFVRPVQLKAGPHFCFVYRHATRDITKNLPPAESAALLESLVGSEFLDAHLFTREEAIQFTTDNAGKTRFSVSRHESPAPAQAETAPAHDRTRHHTVRPDSHWLHLLGVMNERGQPREGMAGKFRQINKFVEILAHLSDEARLSPPAAAPLRIADMGCGKGYLTFATAEHFGAQAEVVGIESRDELVALCNGHARTAGLANLSFKTGHIADTPLAALDVLIALHACDTATDDALAKGLAAGARLIVVSPCCQKELRPQLRAPAVLADALQHGIFQERQAEFVTDALRAQLLEYAGYKTKVFEFISTEHTAKNVMITAIKTTAASPRPTADALRAFAQFYGIRTQRLAEHLGVALT